MSTDKMPLEHVLTRTIGARKAPDVLLVLPPFAGIDRPSIGLHVLQACGRAVGLDIRVLYANLLFAEEIGLALFEQICYAPTTDLLGERIFAPVAYGTNPSSASVEAFPGYRRSSCERLAQHRTKTPELQKHAASWTRALAQIIADFASPVVGCNTTFEQTSAAIALLRLVKERAPTIRTIIGGANCEGAMAAGIAELAPYIDHVFSGECEQVFPQCMSGIVTQTGTPERIVSGSPCEKLDDIPELDYSDYYEQLEALELRLAEPCHILPWLPYETSRGCWWGQKHHCTFCGINGTGMGFRRKSAEKAFGELQRLVAKHPSDQVLFVDNIIPIEYFHTLLPALAKRQFKMHAFYETKANLTLERVELFRNAGIGIVQPGIEALSTSLLARMKKGVTAAQNIALLRFARSVDLAVNWNLLYAFPGDLEEEYERTLFLLPLLRHLAPPSGACHLSIDRFSPYFDHPEQYGVSGIRPMPAYDDIFPSHFDAAKIAYHFVADYDCSHRRSPDVTHRIEDEVAQWREDWSQGDQRPPVLSIEQLESDAYVLVDTRFRQKGGERVRFLNAEQAKIALVTMKEALLTPSLVSWATSEAKVALADGGKLVPLATARPSILRYFESLREALSPAENGARMQLLHRPGLAPMPIRSL